MDKAEFEALIKDLEGELGLLKARYEQWIQGMERVPPMRQKERLERRLRQLRREQPNNTAMRYRFQAVYSRWTTMNTYWQRITRQIEEGTFRRDVKKAKQRHRKIEAQQKRDSQPAAVVPNQPLELDLDADFDSEIGAALSALEETSPGRKKAFGRPVSRSQMPKRPPQQPPPSPGAQRPPPPPAKTRAVPPAAPRRAAPPPPPGAPRVAPRAAAPPVPTASHATRSSLTDGDLQRVYDQYVDAKKRNNERVDNLSPEKLAKKIRAMEPKLRKKYGSANVDFEVVTKGGRVGLKPKKKK